jgi:small-conductance mechanosensitive channel
MFRQVILCLLLATAPCQTAPGQSPPAGGDEAEVQAVEVKAPAPDEAIQRRIDSVFSQVEEFRKIEVHVRSGVVTLSGEVPGTRSRGEALALARRTEGVVMALDRLEETAEITVQLSPAVAKVRDLGKSLAAKLPLIVIALIVVAVFLIAANFLYRRETWFARLRVSSLGRTLARRIVRIAVITIGVLLALEILDAAAIVGAVLGAAGLVGIAIGFAFKNILENYLSGILLSTRNPFDIGDVVEIEGETGKVARLSARDTVLVTLDGNHLRIPNSIVINSKLLNFTRNPLRRFEFVVGVSVDLDLNTARQVGLAALSQNAGVLHDPAPAVLVDNLGESAVNLRFFAWLDQTQHDFLKTRSHAIRLVKEAFDQAEIEMPEPIYRVLLRGGGENPAAGPAKPAPLPSPPGHPPAEDLSADRSIDRQIEEERRLPEEENLLPDADTPG